MKRTNESKKKILQMLQRTNERYREEEEVVFDNFVWDKLNRI